MILDAVGKYLSRNSNWVDTVHQSLCCSWEHTLASRPDVMREIKRKIEENESATRRMVKIIEGTDHPPSGILARLDECSAERRELEKVLQSHQSQPAESTVRPTRDFTEDKLVRLSEIVRSPTPAANDCLRQMFPGSIIVEEIPTPRRKRRHWQGTLFMQAANVAATAVPSIPTSPDSSDGEAIVVLDFVAATKTHKQGVRAWELYQAGKLLIEIAAELGVSKPRIGAILKATAEERGEEYVDGRQRRAGLQDKTVDPSEYNRLLVEAKRLYDDDLPMQQIGTVLGVCRDTVTHLISEWHRRNGLSMEDGRARRARINKNARNSAAVVE